jgi:hypothetical protein
MESQIIADPIFRGPPEPHRPGPDGLVVNRPRAMVFSCHLIVLVLVLVVVIDPQPSSEKQSASRKNHPLVFAQQEIQSQDRAFELGPKSSPPKSRKPSPNEQTNSSLNLPCSFDEVLVAGQFFQPHRSPRMQPVRANPYLSSKPELGAVIEPR